MNSLSETRPATHPLRLASALAACLTLTCSMIAAAQEPPCADGSNVVAAVLLESPLPTLAAVSEGCAGFEAPTVKFQVGIDGKTYYLYLETSTTCAEADAELRRWLACWTYQPARCGDDPVTEVVELELSPPETAEWGVEPPCERESENDPDPEGDKRGEEE
jgi:hypothetical protein